jgi:hypothetical protein
MSGAGRQRDFYRRAEKDGKLFLALRKGCFVQFDVRWPFHASASSAACFATAQPMTPRGAQRRQNQRLVAR